MGLCTGLPAQQRRQRKHSENMLRFVSLTDIMDSYERIRNEDKDVEDDAQQDSEHSTKQPLGIADVNKNDKNGAPKAVRQQPDPELSSSTTCSRPTMEANAMLRMRASGCILHLERMENGMGGLGVSNKRIDPSNSFAVFSSKTAKIRNNLAAERH